MKTGCTCFPVRFSAEAFLKRLHAHLRASASEECRAHDLQIRSLQQHGLFSFKHEHATVYNQCTTPRQHDKLNGLEGSCSMIMSDLY